MHGRSIVRHPCLRRDSRLSVFNTMLKNITIDTSNIMAEKNIHDRIFRPPTKGVVNKENKPLPSPSPKHDDYLSRSQLNRGLSRFAALGTAVEEREKVLQLQEALTSKTDEFEQRNLLLIRSKDALEELGKRCAEAQERADASAAEVVALASSAETAQRELVAMQERYNADMETMDIKFTSLEQEVVRLKEMEAKFKHYKFAEEAAKTGRSMKENELYRIIGEQNDQLSKQKSDIETLKLKYNKIIEEQNSHIASIQSNHVKEISTLEARYDKLKGDKLASMDMAKFADNTKSFINAKRPTYSKKQKKSNRSEGVVSFSPYSSTPIVTTNFSLHHRY